MAEGDLSSAWPTWFGPIMAFTMLGAVAVVYTGIDADRPGLLLGLLLLAIVPWLYEAFRTECDAPYLLFGVLVAAMVALHPVGQAIGVTDPDGNSQASFLILLVGCAQLAAMRATASWILLSIATLAIIIVASYVGPSYGSAGVWAGALVFTLLGGLLVRKLLRSNAELHRAHAALATQAAAEERRRIAREVHDVIAHSMTVTMLHVTAARMAVQRGDVTGAAEALEEAERAGRASLADIRTTVGLLREDGVGVEPVAPTGADVQDLITRYRTAGLAIEAAVDTRLASVPPATGLVVYRIVQEALANVAKHVPGASATVLVSVDGTEVQVHVVNDGPQVPDSGGHGLRGMRERVEALGGRFDAGPTPTGWRVWAALP